MGNSYGSGNVRHTPNRVLYSKALEHQRELGISKSQRSEVQFKTLKITLGLLGLGILWLGIMVIVSLPLSTLGAIHIFGYLGGTFSFLAGLFGTLFIGIRFLTDRRKTTKIVRCAGCQTEHEILSDVTKLICRACYTLLFTGSEEKATTTLGTCGYCGLETAATPQCHPFPCPNCGVLRTANQTELDDQQTFCPQCNASLPAMANYCRRCNKILKVPYPDDILSRVGMDSEGQLYFAKAMLDEFPGDSVLTKVALKKVAVVTDVLASVEAATENNSSLDDPAKTKLIAEIIPKLDLAYSNVLSDAFKQCESICKSLGVNDKASFTANEDSITLLIAFARMPWRQSREHIESHLGDEIRQSGGIGVWDPNPIFVSPKDHQGKRSVNFERLGPEKFRFGEWRWDQLTDNDGSQCEGVERGCDKSTDGNSRGNRESTLFLDKAHGTQLNDFPDFARLLSGDRHVKTWNKGSLTLKNLGQHESLILVAPNKQWDEYEIVAVREYVRQGGRLNIFTLAGRKPDYINKLLETFSIRIESAQITEKVLVRPGFQSTLTALENVESLAANPHWSVGFTTMWTSNQANTLVSYGNDRLPIIVYREIESGSVCVASCLNFFGNKQLKTEGNAVLLDSLLRIV